MQLRFAALTAATALVGLSVLFASEPVSAPSPIAAAKTFVVVEPEVNDCPWKTGTDPAA